MGNLIRMDLYRMNKGKAFRACLLVAFILALGATPFEWGMIQLSRMIAPNDPAKFKDSVSLAYLISHPVSSTILMLAFLSIVAFFFEDMESGYIKNIAGQMPKKGYSVLSRFIAAIPHNLAFMLTGLIGFLLGSLPFQKITLDGSILESIGTFLLKLLLMQSICAILVLIATSFRNKSLGMILAVLLGLPVMTLVYLGINSGLQQVFGKSFDMTPYVPDQLLKEEYPNAIRAILVSAVTICIFLPLSIYLFDKKYVK